MVDAKQQELNAVPADLETVRGRQWRNVAERGGRVAPIYSPYIPPFGEGVETGWFQQLPGHQDLTAQAALGNLQNRI